MLQPHDSKWRIKAALVLALGLTLAIFTARTSESLLAQQPPADAAAEPAGPSAGGDAAPAPADDEATPPPTAPEPATGIKLWELIWKGGIFMIPIVMLLILVITFGIERALGLRRSKVMPNDLIDALGQLSASPGGFDPRKAYRICQQFPSAASNVIRAMLLKVGRPHSEVEHAVAEASDREASRMYNNVGWLTLAAAVAPLMGLFGTVWGMIVAFHDSTQLAAGQNMAEQLAKGIYTALVTTLGGLFVAIPAAILAHFFESRIRNLFHEVDELLFSLMPQVERYEGRLRVSRQHLSGGDESTDKTPAPPAEARVPASTPK